MHAEINAKEQEIKAKDQVIAQLQRRLAEALEQQHAPPALVFDAINVDSNPDLIAATPEGLARHIKKGFEDALGALDGMERFIIGSGVPGSPVRTRRKSLDGA